MNAFDMNFNNFTFHNVVYGTPLHINLDLITHVLGVPQVMESVAPFPYAMTPTKQSAMTMCIYFKNHNWGA